MGKKNKNANANAGKTNTKTAPATTTNPTPQQVQALLAANYPNPLSSSSTSSSSSSSESQHLLDKLSSGTSVQRSIACSAIAHIVQYHTQTSSDSASSTALPSVIQPVLLQRLLPLLYESDIDVQVAAAGAIRNISAFSYKACELLIQQQAVTALLGLIGVGGKLHSATTTTETNTALSSLLLLHPHQYSLLLVQLLSTLSNLCQSFESVAIAITNNSSVILQLLHWLSPSSPAISSAIIYESSQLLLNLTEENNELKKQLNTTEIVKELIGIMNVDGSVSVITPAIRVAIAGILFNLQESQFILQLNNSENSSRDTIETSELHKLIGLIIHTLTKAIEINPTILMKQLIEKVEIEKKNRALQNSMRINPRTKSTTSSTSAATINNDGMEDEVKDSAAIASVTDEVVASVCSDVNIGSSSETKSIVNDNDGTIVGVSTNIYEDPNDQHVDNSSSNSTNKEQTDAQLENEWLEWLDQSISTMWRDPVLALKQSIELLTNICSLPSELIDQTSDTDSTYSGAEDESTAQIGFIPQLLVQSGVVNKLTAQLRIYEELIIENKKQEWIAIIEEEGQIEKITAIINEVMLRTSGAISNMVLYMPANVLGELGSLLLYVLEMLTSIAASSSTASAPSTSTSSAVSSSSSSSTSASASSPFFSLEFVESLTQLTWQLSRKLINFTLPKPFLQLLVSCIRSPSSTEIRLNCIGTLHTLGQLQEQWGVNIVIGGLLIEVLQAEQLVCEQQQYSVDPSAVENSLELQCELLNGLIDLYSEDDRHLSVWNGLNMLTILDNCVNGSKGFAKRVKEKLKIRGKGQNKQLLRRLEETLINATEFIKYKKSHV